MYYQQSTNVPASRRGGAWRAWTGFLFLLLTTPFAFATPVQYDLEFQTSGQSMWGTGEAFQFEKTQFLGAQWQDKSAGFNAIAGSADSSIINPARIAYDTAFAGCRALGVSSSGCINGQSGRLFVPALGSRPRVRSCGRFNFGCQAARLGDLSRRAGYDAAFATCRLAYSSSVCRNGQSARIPFVALGTAPPETLTLDTRTGAAVSATSDGRVGLELGVEIDSGSVDATVSYQAVLDIPDTVGLDKSTAINFNANSILAGTNSLQTTFPGIDLSIDAILELSGSVNAEACLIGPGCTSDGVAFDIAERASVVSFNENNSGEVLLLERPPSFYGIQNADGFPLEVDAAGLATTTFHLPQPDASGGLDASTGTLKASASDDLIDLILDLDNIAATSAGLPGLFGRSADFGPISVGFDIINVGMGPTIDLVQDFELDPTLFVSLFFDQAVMIGGQMVTELVSAWDTLPDITFLSDVTTVTPTFFLDASLRNATSLDFDLELMIDLLQVSWDAPLIGSDSFGIGNVLSQGVNLFNSGAFFDSLFDLGGFNLQIGESFIVDFVSGSQGPDNGDVRSAVNPILDLPDTLPTGVPAPGALLLLLGGLSLIVVRRHVRRPLNVAIKAE
ncbi:MAG: hypothetical protein AAF529_24750 [Pseudomonadota bacterium]